MFILGNVLYGLGQVLFNLLWFYMWVLIARAVLSWVNADPRNTIVRIVYQSTEPPLRLVRRMLPASVRYFPLDIAFLVLFALVLFMQYAVAQNLSDIGLRLRQPPAASYP